MGLAPAARRYHAVPAQRHADLCGRRPPVPPAVQPGSGCTDRRPAPARGLRARQRHTGRPALLQWWRPGGHRRGRGALQPAPLSAVADHARRFPQRRQRPHACAPPVPAHQRERLDRAGGHRTLPPALASVAAQRLEPGPGRREGHGALARPGSPHRPAELHQPDGAARRRAQLSRPHHRDRDRDHPTLLQGENDRREIKLRIEAETFIDESLVEACINEGSVAQHNPLAWEDCANRQFGSTCIFSI
ncbi:hypothetical protein MES4922_20142 [Mesorhizobium ventifaucium]|uniref:Uncharacterized protein n=1 Tax=Mesorhizobium ventifaucium TaxID=666020 RepID=A0ABN8JMA0_9HYPH|nr:hypothetical protein MES4922_20142 [Mesorhizobium ventifaucium]